MHIHITIILRPPSPDQEALSAVSIDHRWVPNCYSILHGM